MSFWSVVADIVGALVAGSAISPTRKALVEGGLELIEEAEEKREEGERLADIPPIEGTMTLYIEVPKKEKGD